MAALNFPSPAAPGDIHQGDNGVTYIFLSDGLGGGYWSGASSANNEAPNIDIGNDPPPFPKEGDLWWDSTVTSGRLYVYYKDGDSEQWVEASPAAGEDSIDNLWKKVDDDLSPIEDTDNVIIGGGNITLNADGSAKFLKSTSGYDAQFLLSNGGNSFFLRGDPSKGQGFYIHGDEAKLFLSSNGNDVGTGQGPVELDGLTGSATFAGNVKVESGSDGIAYVDSRGYFQGMRQTGADVCFIAGTGNGINGTKNAQIFADGSATFAGDVNVGSNTEGTFVGAGGGIVVRRAVTENSNNSFLSLISTNSGSEDEKIGFRTDGSAEFADTVKIGGTLPDAPNISLNANGSAEFESRVWIGQNNSTNGSGLLVGQFGAAQIGYDGEARFGSGNITLNKDGSATFAGIVESTRDEGNNFTVSGTVSRGNGKIRSRDGGGPGQSNYYHYFADTGNDQDVAYIATDGSAYFEGGVQVGGSITGGVPTANIKLNAAGTFTVNSTFTGGGDKVISMTANNSAEKFYVSATGQIYSKSTTIQAITSERRLKENIVAIDSNSAWETIKSTPYYSYNFIGSDTVTYGPMADEVPVEMVVQPMEKNEAGVMVAHSDDEGPIRTYDNGMLQARLYTALQTALTRIETLEQTNASLEARLTALEGAN